MIDTEGMSDKAKDFLSEIEAVCLKHKIAISTSGYDGMQLWKLKDGDNPLYCAGIEDLTDA